MKVTQLKDHALLKGASAVAREYIAKCDPADREQDPLATKRESYAIETFLSIGSIVSCVDQLHFSIEMLSGYRSRSMPGKMNRYDYIVFGIENYFLRTTSVFDRCLRLANVIFQLGLPERQCSQETIIKNSHLKGTRAAKTLSELNKFTNPFRFQRNTVAHQQTYREKDLEKLGIYYTVADEDSSVERYHYLCKKMTDDYVLEKKTEFKENLEKQEDLVDAYFDAVRSAFEARLSMAG